MIRSITHAACVALLLITLGPAAAAMGASPNAVDQYTEQVPTAVGEKPTEPRPGSADTSTGGTGGAGSSDDSGTAAAPSADVDGPGGNGSADPAGGDSAGSGEAGNENATADGSSGSASDPAISGATEDSSGEGMGLLFPIALIGGLLVVGSILVLRARRGGQGPVSP